jgi:probable LLM family oxidoreductase
MARKKDAQYTFGLDTFGDIIAKKDGTLMSDAESIRHVVKEAVLADKLGIDVIGIGEHHREEFAISSPETVLAGIATVTKNIKLSSAVTVLSSDDPVRVYQRFATVDALSNGRAQIILGRGSFTESFPLFGYDLRDYDVLFEEKFDLFSHVRKEKPVTWSGTARAALEDADIFPKTDKGTIETFVGIGGSPQSVIRAAAYDIAPIFAIIGGAPERFKAYVDLYHESVKEFGRTAHPIGMHSPGYIAETDEEAIKHGFVTFKETMDKVGKSRGWQPISYEHFKNEVEHGSLYVGSPETVARKIARAMKSIGATRFDMVYGLGPVTAEARLTMIELYATKVIPRVKELFAEDA